MTTITTTMDVPDIHSDASSPEVLGKNAHRDVGRRIKNAHGDGALLDLSGLSDDGIEAAVRLVRHGRYEEVAATVQGVHNCAHPVRLEGYTRTEDTATGEVLSSFSSADAPMGVLHRPCGNRRAEVCPACSRTYARDTFELIRAGIAGGKTVPDSVADNPLLFATFTPPSFGPVHRGPKNGQPVRCHPREKPKTCPHGRRIVCWKTHTEDDRINGAPICDDCYDWDQAVVWQWWAPKLWSRTTTAIKRALASRLGVTDQDLRDVASLQYAKVAEYQARGVVHFHALIRLDGPGGPGSPAPLDGNTLAKMVDRAARGVVYQAPSIDADDYQRDLRWGEQLDIKTVRNRARTDDPDGPLTAEQVAGYLAKYATKDANSIQTPGVKRPHLVRLHDTCMELFHRVEAVEARAARTVRNARLAGREVDDPEPSPYRLIGKWSHMLGFRGHYGSKSRGYSVTLGKLRRARQRFQELTAQARREGEELDTRDLEARLLADDEEDDETIRVVSDWTYQGTGWTHHDAEALALSAAARAREYDRRKTATKTATK